MKIISIDIGIKNMAYCIMQSLEDKTYRIDKWDVINLCGDPPVCEASCKKGLCGKKAKYRKEDHFFCKSHAKASGYTIPTARLAASQYKRTKLAKLVDVAKDYDIEFPKPARKVSLLAAIDTYIKDNLLETIKTQSANQIDLISIGRAIMNKFNEEISCDSIDHVVIENQISPIANRMKSVQGMVAQYFIMKGSQNISFVSASNKLKPFIGTKKTSYSERKKLGIEITKKEIIETSGCSDWLPWMSAHKKKDDLADSFLQGLSFLNSLTLVNIVSHE